MLEVAKAKTPFPEVEYRCCAMEDVEFPEESFDVILSSLAIHYVEDYETLVKKIYSMLKPGGSLAFTVEHPVFTAHGAQDWHYDEKGEILHFPVDNYYDEGKRATLFLGEQVIKFHFEVKLPELPPPGYNEPVTAGNRRQKVCCIISGTRRGFP